MKQLGITITITAVILLAIISGCKKDSEDDSNSPISTNCSTTSMKFSSNNILNSEYQFEYDTNNLLAEKIYLEYNDDGSIISGNYNVYEYNSSGQPIEYVTYNYIDNSIDEKTVFDVNGNGDIIKHQTFKKVGDVFEPDNYVVFEDYSNQIPKKISHYNEIDELYRAEILSVTNGNISEIEIYRKSSGIENIDNIIEFTHNDKNSPYFSNIGFLNDSYDPTIFFSKNCFIKIVAKDGEGVILSENSFSFSNYNSNNFPREMIINEDFIDVEYDCID